MKVANIKEDIDYYVNENQAVDFTEDEDIYNDLNLQDEEDMYGVGDNDHGSSLDAQSVTEEHPPTPQKEEAARNPRNLFLLFVVLVSQPIGPSLRQLQQLHLLYLYLTVFLSH